MPSGLRVLLPLCALVAIPGWGDDAGIKLLREMQKALGGGSKFAAIRDYEELATAEIFTAVGQPAGKVQKRTRWIAPDYLRIDQTGPGDTYVLYFDGASGWEILPDRARAGKTAGGVIELKDGELKFAQQYLSGLIFKKWMADRQPGYSISSPAPNALRITDAGARVTDIVLDAKTKLPRSETSSTTEMRIGGWTKVSGLRLPTARENYHDGVKLAQMTAGRIRVNSELTVESLRAKPADSLPRMTD